MLLPLAHGERVPELSDIGAVPAFEEMVVAGKVPIAEDSRSSFLPLAIAGVAEGRDEIICRRRGSLDRAQICGSVWQTVKGDHAAEDALSGRYWVGPSRPRRRTGQHNGIVQISRCGFARGVPTCAYRYWSDEVVQR